MKILVIGSGGREHAIAWKIAQSPNAGAIFVAPGNGGTDGAFTNVPLALEPPFEEVLAFIEKERIGLTVIGPEKPLVDGMADVLRAKGHRVFGPGKAGARLEGSKSFAKEIMKAAGVPTAAYESFTSREKALAWLKGRPGPYVLKADGLAAGKGVIIAEDLAAAEAALDEYFVKHAFGAAGTTLVIEDFLRGYEVSILAITDGTAVKLLPASQDHKRARDNDEGPNTGGMGVYSPVPPVTEAHLDQVRDRVLLPTLAELRRRGIPYCGVLYAGLMIEGDRVNVVEFNARFGDPETECVLPLLGGDLLEIFLAATEGRLSGVDFRVEPGAACTVILASGGYPGAYQNGKEIKGLENVDDSLVFHAGTKKAGDKTLSAGGRVLAVTHKASDLGRAIQGAYADVDRIHFEGGFCRRDIGKKGLPQGAS